MVLNKNEPHPPHFPRILQHIHILKLKEVKHDIRTRSNKKVKNKSNLLAGSKGGEGGGAKLKLQNGLYL